MSDGKNSLTEIMTIVMVVVLGAVGAFAAQKQKSEPQQKAAFCQCCGQRLPDSAPTAKPAQTKPQPTKPNKPRGTDAFDIVAPFIF